jgi:catalase
MDALTHKKFIGFSTEAKKLFEKFSLTSDLDNGCIEFSKKQDIKTFIQECRKIRFWKRS